VRNGSVLSKGLDKLKKLETYLDRNLPGWVPREMPAADLLLASAVTTATSADLNMTARRYGTVVGYEYVRTPFWNCTSPIRLLEDGSLSQYMVSQFKLVPGMVLSTLFEFGLYTLISYGLYKMANKALEHKELPYMALTTRIPPYTFLFAMTCFHIMGVYSWL
jgi:hypothetical protein